LLAAYFHFKKFSVRHDRSGMKVGTDGVLLGAWVDVKNTTHILDIGTGTGVIALMLAQRATESVTIDAVEIDANAFADAQENIAASPWHDRIQLHHTAIQQFDTTVKFDLMVSNPPYFQKSFKPPTAQRETARHTEQLTFDDIVTAAERLLSPIGKLNIILPYTEALQFITLADHRGLFCLRKWNFRTRGNKPIERLLLEFGWHAQPSEEGEILLYHSGESWSDEYKKLTGDFYLKI
jgi:tRNA1Val (adenine37-N6)-methyltransferase